jgi:hypothetical protein
MAAPLGNQNATKAKEFRQALKRALARKSGSTMSAALEEIATKLAEAAYAGEQWAIREVADRLDGKPAQAIIGGDEDDPAVKTISEILIRAVDP